MGRAGFGNGWNVSPFLGTEHQFGWEMFGSPAFLCWLSGKSAPKPEHFGSKSGHGTSPCMIGSCWFWPVS